MWGTPDTVSLSGKLTHSVLADGCKQLARHTALTYLVFSLRSIVQVGSTAVRDDAKLLCDETDSHLEVEAEL